MLEWLNLDGDCNLIHEDQPPLPDNVLLSWAKARLGSKNDGAGGFTDRRTFADHFAAWEKTYNFRIRLLHSVFVDVGMGAQFAQESMDILHVVPLFRHRSIVRKRCLFDAPTTRNIQKIIASRLADDNPDGDPATGSKSKWQGLGIQKVLTFLDSCSEIRAISRMAVARKKFQNLELELAFNPDVLREVQWGNDWNYESLRRARVNLDATACLLFRTFWLSLPFASLFIYVFIDASPQWKGVELFAASFDITVGTAATFFQRRRFLQCSIGL